MADGPTRRHSRTPAELRLQAANMASLAVGFWAYTILAVCAAIYMAVNHALLLNGVGSASLAWLIWWSLTGVIAGAGGVAFTAVGSGLRGLAASIGDPEEPRPDDGGTVDLDQLPPPPSAAT